MKLFLGIIGAIQEFEADMFDIMSDADSVKRAMIKDIYGIGKVLSERKYPYLKSSSLIFIFGLVISILVFAIEYIIAK